MSLHEGNLEKVREELRQYAAPICKSAEETPLPPLRAINHTIPLIYENKVYHWRPLRCPEPLREQWNMRRAAYIRITGVAGVVSQGADWKTAKVAAFYSAKLNSAQQNYAVHEIEMLTGVETMLRHRDILQGVKFQWLTDHKGLIHLLTQKNLTGHQARWMEKISEFDFTLVYIAWTENVLSDVLSRIYSNEAPGTEHARSEYIYHDVIDNDELDKCSVSVPVLTRLEGEMVSMSLEPHYNLHKDRKLTEKGTLLAGLGQELPTIEEEGSLCKISHKGKKGGIPDEIPKMDTNENPNPEISQYPVMDLPQLDEVEPTVHEDVVPTPPPSLLHVITESTLGLDIASTIRFRYLKDPFFKAIIDKPKDFHNFVVANGLVYLNNKDQTVLCIPHVKHEGCNLREIVIGEAHSLLAHLSTSRTVDYL